MVDMACSNYRAGMACHKNQDYQRCAGPEAVEIGLEKEEEILDGIANSIVPLDW